MRALPELPNDRLRIEAWTDPVVDLVGHPAQSDYVETYWLGILGPSTTWLLRRLNLELASCRQGFWMEFPETAARLGIGMRGGQQSPFHRSVGRLVQFELATMRSPETLAVRQFVPTLPRRHLIRLPHVLQRSHHELMERQLQDA